MQKFVLNEGYIHFHSTGDLLSGRLDLGFDEIIGL